MPSTRETMPTGVALDQLLEAVSAVGNRDDALEELAAESLRAARIVEFAGRRDLAALWAAFGQLVCSVAEDKGWKTEGGCCER